MISMVQICYINCYFVQYIVILSDYLMLNFIRNCEKKNVYFFYLHFFFSEIDFYCNIEDFVIFFFNPEQKTTNICFEMQIMPRMCFDRKFTFKPSSFNY